MTDPWDERYIYLHVFLLMVNVGKYTSPMDPMGIYPEITKSIILKYFPVKTIVLLRIFK